MEITFDALSSANGKLTVGMWLGAPRGATQLLPRHWVKNDG